MSVSLAQHRQLAAVNKHKNLEIFSCRNCCTASNYGPMASGFGMLHYINLKHQCNNSVQSAAFLAEHAGPAVLKQTLSPLRDLSGTFPDTSHLQPLSCLHYFF